MQLDPVLSALQAGLSQQMRIATDDPQVEAAGAQLIETLAPALRNAAVELAQQAATEVDAQLPDHSVTVVLSGSDIELRVDEAAATSARPVDEELDARITLRLPPSLKSTIERFANVDGESVNSWVVETLSKRANRDVSAGHRVTEDFDL